MFPAMRVAERVWQIWQEREANFLTPAINLLLRTDVPPETAYTALADAVDEVMLARAARADNVDEFRSGYCTFTRVPDGVFLRIDEGPDDFEGLLGSIVDRLRDAGVEGEFDVYESDVCELPETIDLFECHLRVQGERGLTSRGRPLWKPESEALITAAAAGIEWCLGNRPELPVSLKVSLLPAAKLSADSDVLRYLRDAIEATNMPGGGVIELTSAAPDRFRTFALTSYSGRIGLIEGGDATKRDWERSANHVTRAMRSAASWAVYGFVKRGSLRIHAVLGTSLPSDWLEVPHMNALVMERDAFEDEFVPDAFGAQLLSAGHLDRLPTGPRWRIESLPTERCLVEHVDPSVWFDGSLVRFGGHPNPFYNPFPPTPAFLTQARQDFDALLYRDRR